MKLSFSKYQGTGNDFIIADDRENKIQLSGKQVKWLCNRRFGIGADGLILLRNLTGFDFEMVYYNSDGNESSMCGNGGRCITAFADKLNKITDKAIFSAIDGKHEALITGHSPLVVKLKMGEVNAMEDHPDFVYLNTGSPHFVKFVNDVSEVDVVSEGRKIRNSERFKEIGTNVNFVQTTVGGLIVRTYERGVEDETLSCGTGVTASALAAVQKNKVAGENNVIDIFTPGGKLKVYFERNNAGFKNIWLEGEAKFVFDGEVEVGN